MSNKNQKTIKDLADSMGHGRILKEARALALEAQEKNCNLSVFTREDGCPVAQIQFRKPDGSQPDYRPSPQIGKLIIRLNKLQEYIDSTEPWPASDDVLAALPEVIELLKKGEPYDPEPHPDSGQGKWKETAIEFSNGCDFYHGLIKQIGDMFGEAARTSDDGSIQDSVLALKVPELVAELLKKKSVE